MDFISASEGWASGGFTNVNAIKKRAALIHTVDGGLAWTEIPLPGGYNNANAVHFANGNEGWVSLQGSSPDSDFGASTLVSTRNGGATWTLVLGPVGKNVGFTLAPRSGPPLAAWGPQSAAYDPGQTVPRMWINPGGTGGFRPVRMPATVYGVQDASVVGGVVYALVGLYRSGPGDPAAALLKSSDWGSSWAQVGPVDQFAWRLNVFDAQRAVAFGYQNNQCCSAPSDMSGRMLATSDGGQTWLPLPLPAGVGCARGDFIDARTARLACRHNGGLGDLMATDDGGAHWTSRPLPDTNWPRYSSAVFFLDANHGWAAGSGSDGKHTLSSTSDGGLHWRPAELH